METKRISLIPKNPNPLFKKWLKELIEDAEKKKKRISQTYQKALDSLEKYPLTIFSGFECAILENFGPKICQILDEKLQKHLDDEPNLKQALCYKDKISELQRREAEKVTDMVRSIEAACLTDDSYAPVAAIHGFEKDFEMEDICSLPDTFEIVKAKSFEAEERENVAPDIQIPIELLSQSEESEDSLDRLMKKYDPEGAEQRKIQKKTKVITKRQKLTSPVTDDAIIDLSQSPRTSPSFDMMNSPISTHIRSGGKLRRFKTFDNSFSHIAGPSYASSPISKFLDVQEKHQPLPISPVVALDDDDDMDEFDRLVAKYAMPSPIAAKTKSPVKAVKIDSNPKLIQNAGSIMPQAGPSLVRKPSNSRLKAKAGPAAQKPAATQCIPEDDEEEIKYISVDDINPLDYDVKLLVDLQETSRKTKASSDDLIKKLNEGNVMNDVRKLHVGDFAWIAQHKVDKSKELVLPYIVERKRLDDLSSSIKDGRFHEQKFRLNQCGVENVVYLIENVATKGGKLQHGLPFTTLLQAATNTQIHSKFQVKFTESNQHTILYLTVMTTFIENIFKNKAPVKFRMMEFLKFNQSAVKQKRCTVREMFIKQLLALKGLSVDIALEITKFYPTPTDLYDKYLKLSNIEGELLLTRITIGDLKRKIPAPVSKSIYTFYMRNI